MLRTAILVPLLASALAAQPQATGYRSQLRALPDGASSMLALDRRDVVYFTGTRLVLDDGSATRDLLTLDGAAFGSFTIRVDTDTLLFGATTLNGTDGVWLVPLRGAARRLASIPLNYDAVAWRPGLVLVSAKTGGFGAADNDIIAVDLQSGALDPIAAVSGASGPLAVDAEHNLYYATSSAAFPAPPGEVDVVRFSAAQVASAIGPGELTLADACVLHSGLDAAGRLAFDDDGDLLAAVLFFFADGSVAREVVELSDIGGARPRLGRLLDLGTTPFAPEHVQFVAADRSAGAVFEPFQPDGGALLVQETDYLSGATRLRAIAAARPATTVVPEGVIGRGPFTIATSGGPPLGAGLLVVGPGHLRRERVLTIAGFEQPLFWMPMLGLALPVAFDGSGRAERTLFNPGLPFPLPMRTQTLFVDQAGSTLGSAAPAAFILR